MRHRDYSNEPKVIQKSYFHACKKVEKGLQKRREIQSKVRILSVFVKILTVFNKITTVFDKITAGFEFFCRMKLVLKGLSNSGCPSSRPLNRLRHGSAFSWADSPSIAVGSFQEIARNPTFLLFFYREKVDFRAYYHIIAG